MTPPLEIALPEYLTTTSVAIAAGLIIGLIGWPLYAVAIRVAGAALGLALGVGVVVLIDQLHPMAEIFIPMLAVASVVGLVFGIWMMGRVELMAWLLMGLTVGILAAWSAQEMTSLRYEEWHPVAQGALWAGAPLVVGLLTVWLRRWFVIGATAMVGATLLTPHLAPLGPPPMAWWCAGTAGFAAVQFGLHRLVGLEDDDEEDDR